MLRHHGDRDQRDRKDLVVHHAATRGAKEETKIQALDLNLAISHRDFFFFSNYKHFKMI